MPRVGVSALSPGISLSRPTFSPVVTTQPTLTTHSLSAAHQPTLKVSQPAQCSPISSTTPITQAPVAPFSQPSATTSSMLFIQPHPVNISFPQSYPVGHPATSLFSQSSPTIPPFPLPPPPPVTVRTTISRKPHTITCRTNLTPPLIATPSLTTHGITPPHLATPHSTPPHVTPHGHPQRRAPHGVPPSHLPPHGSHSRDSAPDGITTLRITTPPRASPHPPTAYPCSPPC